MLLVENDLTISFAMVPRVTVSNDRVLMAGEQPIQAVDRALLLRHDPLLARASAAQLLALIQVATEVPLTQGAVLFDSNAQPAIYQVVQGELVVESDNRDPVVVSAGATIGVAETLAGVPSGIRAVVRQPGRAIRVDRENLFNVLTDHVDLMQGLFNGVITLRRSEPTPTVATAVG
jgi:CRP-like cAMP-binding protein